MSVAAVQNDLQLASLPAENVFPLPLSDFEFYMFADDRPSHPMVFVMLVHVTGELLREELSAAVHEAIQCHPLFASRVRRISGRGWCWVAETPGETIEQSSKQIQWHISDQVPQENDPVEIRTINLQQDRGLQIVVDYHPQASRIIFYLHHCCCDGIGGVQIAGEVMARYGQMTAAADARRPEFELPETAMLRQREHFDTTRSKTVRHRKSRKRLLAKISRLILRRPVPLQSLSIHSDRPSTSEMAAGRRETPAAGAIQSRTLPRTISRGLRAAATRLQVSVNDLCIREMLLLIADWHQRSGGKQGTDPWLRVSVPLSMRSTEHDRMPACNMVSYAFVTRRATECGDPEQLLETIHQQTGDVLFNREGIVALKFLGLVRKVPGLMKLMLRWKSCFCTVVLANVGDVRKRFHGRFPLQHGRWIAGNVVVKNICGVAPVRPNTRAAVTVGDYGDSFGIHLRTDTAVFTNQDSALFLTEYTDRLIRLAETSAAV